MLKNAEVVCFVATANPSVAKKFYRDSLGLPLRDDGPFAMVFDVHGTMLRVQKVQTVPASGYTVLGWMVGDIRAAIKRLVKKGIRFERYDGLTQNDAGVWTTPDGASVAWFKDPDGNVLSLTQDAPKKRTRRRIAKSTSRRSAR